MFHSFGAAQNRPFITEWVPIADSIFIPVNLSIGTYNYDVTWYKKASPSPILLGSETNLTVSKSIKNLIVGDTIIVEINGNYPHFYINNSTPNRESLVNIVQWGDIQWESFKDAMHGCVYLKITATDAPILTNVTDMTAAFASTPSFNSPIDHWDVSNITNMSYTFYNTSVFNQPLNNWNVQNVIYMTGMFENSKAFNQPLNSWNVQNVLVMHKMFAFSAFNSSINDWIPLNVFDMSHMFTWNPVFNQPLDNWNVQSVKNFQSMFSNAYAFNQPLNSWNVSSAEDMGSMFDVFNQPLNNWNVTNVRNMNYMFYNAYAFNQNINSWNVANVTNMDYMFYNANIFNQPLNNWNVTNVRNMNSMFFYAHAFNQNVGSWNIINANNMTDIFANTKVSYCNFDSIITNWSQLPVQNNISLGSHPLAHYPRHSTTGTTPINSLTTNHNWTISSSLYDPLTTISIKPASICNGSLITLQNSALLEVGDSLEWYLGSCSGTLLGKSIDSFLVKPSSFGVNQFSARIVGCKSFECESVNINLTSPSQLGLNNDSKTCLVNSTSFVEFVNADRALLAINSQGVNLGNVTVTSYVANASRLYNTACLA